MTKIVKPIAFGLVVIVIAALLALRDSSVSKIPPVPTTVIEQDSSGKSYSLADISQHGSETSCWTIINGGVYDLSDWIGKHPGGKRAILSICGKDGSGAFNAQHGGAQLQQDILKGYKIGVLSK